MSTKEAIDIEAIRDSIGINNFSNADSKSLENLAESENVKVYHSANRKREAGEVLIKPNMTINESRLALANGIARELISSSAKKNKLTVNEKELSDLSDELTVKILISDTELRNLKNTDESRRKFSYRNKLPYHFVLRLKNRKNKNQ